MITVKRLNVLVVLVMLLALAVPAISYARVPEEDAGRSSMSEVEFTGVISAMDEGSWVVDGQTVKVGPGTEVEGTLNAGDVVKVHARVDSDGGLVAREIEALDDLQDNDSDDNSNATDAMNSNDNDDDHMIGNDNDDEHMSGNDNNDEHLTGNDNDDNHDNGHDNGHDDDDDDHDSNDDHDNDDDD